MLPIALFAVDDTCRYDAFDATPDTILALLTPSLMPPIEYVPARHTLLAATSTPLSCCRYAADIIDDAAAMLFCRMLLRAVAD